MSDTITRCAWANTNFPGYREYHDKEWGAPCHDERRLFEIRIYKRTYTSSIREGGFHAENKAGFGDFYRREYPYNTQVKRYRTD